MAIKTQGTSLYTIDPADGTLLAVSCVTSIDGLDSSRDQLETSCLEGDARTYEAGMATPGTATFGINVDPKDASHIRLHQLKTQGVTLKWAIGWSDGKGILPTVTGAGEAAEFTLPATRSWITFEGFMNSYPFSFALNAVVSSTVGIQVSGDPVLVPKNQLPNDFLLEKQNIKLIAFGDSITAAGASPRTANGNYIYLTGGYWVDAWVQSSQQFEMLDGVGVSGNTTLDLLNRMDDVLLSAADVVMILIGTNDLAQARTPEQTRDSMAQILDQIISAGKKVLITPVPLREVADNLNEKINTLNAYYSELTAERSSHVAMTNTLTQFNQFIEDGNELTVTTDGLHPNTYGAWLIASEVKVALDKYFNSLPVDYVNLAPNPEFAGTGGYVLSGATGEAPDGWGVYYADPSNGLGTESASVVNADGSVSLKTGTVAPYNQVLFKSNKVTNISQNKKYSFGLSVSCGDLSNVSAMRLYMNGSTAPIKSVEFQLKVPAGLTSFNEIKLRTPFIDIGDATYVELYLTVTSNGTAPIELSISNPVLIEHI